MSRRKKNRSRQRKQRAGQKRHAKQQRRSKRNANRPRQRMGSAQVACDCPSHLPRLPEPIPFEPDPVSSESGVATWVPPGGKIVVQGRSIEGGMVYVGREVLSVSGYWTEPGVIDPDLPVDWRRADRYGETLDELPSYPQMSPQARAGYLEWLAGGRSDEHASIGYVLVFFYGLERRILADIGSDLDQPDVPVILAEIIRLLILYGDDPLFSSHANGLMALVEGLFCWDMDIEPLPWEAAGRDGESPLAVLIGIGKSVANGLRIPAEWALRYLHFHPETRLRTAARRCPDKFDELFMARYRARFRGGMKRRPPAQDLRLTYQAASHGFAGIMVFHMAPGTPDLGGDFELGYGGQVSITLDGIPDMDTTPSLLAKLRSLAEECTDELDAYSRFIGRSPTGAETTAAISLLPDVLLASRGGPILDDLRDWTSEMLNGRKYAVIQLDELVQRWSPGGAGKLTKREARLMASFLGRIGVGIEPDVRFGAATPKPGGAAVLFPLPEGAADAPSDGYTAAMPLVHLAAVVAGAGGTISPERRRFLLEHLEETSSLNASQRRRAGAHLEFLATGRLGMYGVKRSVETFPEAARPAVGRFLVTLAAAGGVVGRAEIAALEKVFGYLSLDGGDVYRLMHGLGADDHGPVTVRESQLTARWVIPDPTQVADPRPVAALDPTKVQARLEETERVSALLTGIFFDDDPNPAPGPPPTGPQNGEVIGALDEAHSALLAKLVTRSEWSRSSAARLAESLGLPFLDSALDVINETAMEACGEPVAEGDDPIVLNAYAVEELT